MKCVDHSEHHDIPSHVELPSPASSRPLEPSPAAGGRPQLSVELMGGTGTVWDASAARRLRELRLPGQLGGPLPRAPRQNVQLGLPLTLLSEELHLLTHTGMAEVVHYPALRRPRSPQSQRKLQQLDEASIAQQQSLMAAARHKQLLERADSIAAGKLKKLRKASQDADVTRAQLRHEFVQKLRDKVRPPPPQQCFLQMFCGHPLPLTSLPATICDVTAAGGLRRVVYADLWRRGYHLTDGLKFGADFLAYAGDPLVYHATFLVRCAVERVSPRDLCGLQRLAQSCGKTLLLSRWDARAGVEHTVVSRQRVSLRPLPAEVPAGEGARVCRRVRADDGSEVSAVEEDSRQCDGEAVPGDWSSRSVTAGRETAEDCRADDWAEGATADENFWSSD